jgi:hypothetical protein
LTHSAVTWDRADHWSAAAAEVDRLVWVLCEAEKAKIINLSDEAGAALGELVGCFASGGWWMSNDGTRERLACQEARREEDELSGQECDTGGSSFMPRLLLERDAQYLVAPAVLGLLDAVLLQVAVAMDNLDECRLGVLLSGFGYRSTPQLGVPFVNSVLNNLAAQGMTDLEAENKFRGAVGLSEITEDRCPRSLSEPVPVPTFTVDDVAAGCDESNPFAPYVGDMVGQRDLILACVFQRFDVVVPPAESDALQYPGLAGLKKKLRTASVKAAKAVGKSDLAAQTEFWTQEAIEYLGFNRLDVARPDMLLQRLIKKGALRPTKIGRRNVFKKADLDRVREKGDRVRRRGRPRKDEK